MTAAFWCVLAAALLPYLFTGLAKFTGPRYDNHAPRDWLERLHGWRKRAHWAQLNGFEAFPPFAAGVTVAHLAGAPQGRVDLLAFAWLGFRLAHGAAYLLDYAWTRSVFWSLALLCVAGLFLAGA